MANHHIERQGLNPVLDQLTLLGRGGGTRLVPLD
jgi:hypothetical protein